MGDIILSKPPPSTFWFYLPLTVLVVPHVPCCQIDWCGQHVINRPVEITVASGAMLPRIYSKTTSSVRLLPGWASFPASSYRLPSLFLCVFHHKNLFLHKMGHFCCCAHLVNGIIPIPCLPIATRPKILCLNKLQQIYLR